MKNIILTLIFAVTFISLITSCHDKKDDPQPSTTTTTTSTNNGMDTTLLKNKTWVHTDTLYADRYEIDKYLFNTNGTYINTRINIYPNNPTDTLISNGNYYLQFINGNLFFNFNGSLGKTTYTLWGISKLTSTDFWISNNSKPTKYIIQ